MSVTQPTSPGQTPLAPQRVPRQWRHALFAAGLLSFMLVCVTVSLVAWVVLPLVLLRWSPTAIESGSMRPGVDVGDVVVLRLADGAGLGVGTVVLYDGGPVTGRVVHRVVALHPDGSYVTKGDANPTPDSAAVRPDQVRGTAVLLVPWIGRPAVWAVHGQALPLLVAGAAMVACLRVTAFAFDPAYDPWAGQVTVLPAAVLLSASGSDGDTFRGVVAPSLLLDSGLHDLMLDRAAAQAEAAHTRHSTVTEAST